MDWLKSIAPTVATALGGPLAGIAVEILGPKLGLGQSTTTAVKNALAQSSLAQEQLNGLKQAEAELQAREMEYGFKFSELEFKDRESARRREIDAGDSWTPRILAAVVALAWVVIQWQIVTGFVAQDMRELVARAMGTLDMALGMVLAYYFGSSAGSRRKTEMMAPKADQ